MFRYRFNHVRGNVVKTKQSNQGNVLNSPCAHIDHIGARNEAWIVSPVFVFSISLCKKKKLLLQEDFVMCVFLGQKFFTI